MPFKLSLRARVALTFALLGLVVSTCLAFISLHFSAAYVGRVAREMLRVEGDYFVQRYTEFGVLPQTHSAHFRIFLSGATGDQAPPGGIANLEPGDPYELGGSGPRRYVAVHATADGKRLYIVLDMGMEGVRERRWTRDLIALVLCGTLLSAWLGWFWAGRAIAPVRRLARRVEVLEPSRRGAQKLAPGFAEDEVGALALAFDNYQEKLYGYVRRERAFTADASHELRTPLAVIRGAIEVLLDSGQCGTAVVTRLRRMQRGADELRDLLDALLVLARSDEAEANEGRTPDLDGLVRSLLAERRDALDEKHLRLAHAGEADIAVAAPQKVLRVVLGNLLRAATQFADGGVLRIGVARDAVAIAHERSPAAAEATPLDVREHALGLGMIRRVCERWGWHLEENVGSNGDHAFVLRLEPRPDPA
ncbi:MAG: HAMP domain-containing histidine kinase [Proteobacteria bacterium]|uniref:sensor histidine kinase n=1 Tax=Rudaea sp. TaxID=2136325 RepID=UPI0037844801|nr:HAMP domain-containing histidine kinase [Pseudomonadota bacterium]